MKLFDEEIQPLFAQTAEAIAIDFEFGDVGASQRLIHYFGKDLCYNHTLRRWYLWNSKVWSDDEKDKVYEYAKQLSALVLAEFNGLDRDIYDNKDTEKNYKKLISNLLEENHYRAAVSAAQSEPKIARLKSDFDSNPHLLNLQNGTYDLENMEFRTHSREDYCTKIAGASHVPDAECPLFIDFLDLVFEKNGEIISYLQRFVGYCLSGLTGEKAFVLAFGDQYNGKSTLVKVIAYLMGKYAATMNFKSLLQPSFNNPSGHRSDLVKLDGARFVSVSEGAEQYLDNGLIKQLTGMDDITIRPPYGKRDFLLDNQMKIFLHTNRRPKIDVHDAAMWRRVHELPFNVCIPEIVKPIPDYYKELYQEIDGILNWALRGWQDYLENGLSPPGEILDAGQAHKRELDFWGDFFDEMCELGPDCEVGSDALRQAMNNWLEKNGYKKPITHRALAREMRERGFENIRRETGIIWLGLQLKNQFM
jgi:putative DNA primase/helicase